MERPVLEGLRDKLFGLHFELAGSSQGLDLSLSISEHNVASFLLEIPWSHKDGVSHLDPDSTLHLPTYAADPSDAVSAFDQDPIIAK